VVQSLLRLRPAVASRRGVNLPRLLPEVVSVPVVSLPLPRHDPLRLHPLVMCRPHQEAVVAWFLPSVAQRQLPTILFWDNARHSIRSKHRKRAISISTRVTSSTSHIKLDNGGKASATGRMVASRATMSKRSLDLLLLLRLLLLAFLLLLHLLQVVVLRPRASFLTKHPDRTKSASQKVKS